jgi:hypothetical protein
MRTIRELVLASSRFLARRLEQLQAKLQMLIAQVRDTVVQLVSESLGGAVRDAVEHAIDQVTDYLPRPRCEPRWNSSRAWDDPRARDGEYSDQPDPWFEEPEGAPDGAPEAEQRTSRPLPRRLSVAVATGVHVGAWWRQYWPGVSGALTTVPVALLAGSAAYAVPALALVGLRLAGCVIQLNDFLDLLNPSGMI